MVLPRPQNADSNERLTRQFRRDFRVRRQCVSTWLRYLVRNHPGYQDIYIDDNNLTQLPEDGSVIDQILTEMIADENVDENTDIPEDADHPEVVAVPDMTVSESEAQQLRQQLAADPNPQHLTLPDPRATPISEYKTTLPLLSLALPTLFPNGLADYSLPRERTVKFQDYVQYLMKYKDGRFARHPPFRLIVFNTLMRHRANAQAGFMVKKRSNLLNWTVDQLRAAFEEDTEESNSIVNSLRGCLIQSKAHGHIGHHEGLTSPRIIKIWEPRIFSLPQRQLTISGMISNGSFRTIMSGGMVTRMKDGLSHVRM